MLHVGLFSGAIALGLLVFQAPAVMILLSRLLKGPSRRPPVAPGSFRPDLVGKVSVVIPTLNEALRISPCLEGLEKTGPEVREILVVDSRSTDGTREIIQAKSQQDPRFHLLTDDPLPKEWVGRPWALHTGFLHTSPESEWFLGVDADTVPHPGLVAGLVQEAEAAGYDLVSLSPRFILQYPGECWLQPALLMTLLYRFDPSGTEAQSPERVMANGQCFLARRAVLQAVEGYSSARSSFCDDVTLARHIAAQGFRVGFWDGAKVLKVRMYEGAAETWKEWGRSLDLKDAAKPGQVWGDLWLLTAVQALPIPALLLLLSWQLTGGSLLVSLALGLNLFLVVIRFALLLAIAPSYDWQAQNQPHNKQESNPSWLNSLAFALSPLADPLAVLRILLSTLQRPTQWRGRNYP